MSDDQRSQKGARTLSPAEVALAAEIKAYRKRADLSHDQLAAMLGYSRQYISRAEKPEQGLPSRQLVEGLDRALDARGALVSLHESASANRGARKGERSDDVVEVLNRVQRLAGQIDLGVIGQLQLMSRDIVAQYEKLDQANLASTLLRQRAWVDELLGKAQHPRQRRQLYEVAAITAGALGYLSVGRGQFPLARAYCLEAFNLGDFAEDCNLQAWARGLQSFCEYYDRRYSEALELSLDGLRHSQSGPQGVRLMINGLARALGKLGDVGGVDRAVDDAHRLLADADIEEIPTCSSISLGYYSAAQIAANAATAYVSVGRPDKVESFARIALADDEVSHAVWSRSLITLDLAHAHARAVDADLDYISDLLQRALDLAEGRPVISVYQRASDAVRVCVDRWGPVRQLDAAREALVGANV